MKKKFLSIALVLGMLLSLLSGIPVSAAGEAYTRALPYAFFDYEDGVNNLQGASIVDGGMAGSGKCLKYSSSNSEALHDDKAIYIGNGSGTFTGKVPANHKFIVSFNIKITQQLTKGNLVLFVNYKTESGTNGTNSPLKTFDPTKVNVWQKVEFEALEPTENAEITGLRLRYAGHGAHLTNGNFVVGDETYAVPRDYYFDDMEMAVISPFQSVPGSGGGSTGPTPPAAPVDMTLNDYTMDFENGSSINVGGNAGAGRANVTTTETGNANRKAQLIEEPGNPSNTVLKIWLASHMAGEGEGKRTGQTTIYDFSMNLSKSTASTTLATGSIPPGATWTFTFDYYLPEEMESSNNPTITFYHKRNSATKHIDPLTAPSTVHQTWHTVTMQYTNNSNTTEEIDLTYCGFRLQGSSDVATPWKRSWALKGYTNSTATNYEFGDRSMYFDNFRSVIDDPNAAPPPEVAELSLDNYSMDFESDATIQVNGSNITDTEAGTASELACIAEDPANSNNKAMKLTLAPTAVGTASTIKFSGKSGAGTDKVTAPGTIPAGGKITYIFKYYLANEVDDTVAPAFRVKHATGGAIATQATPFATTAGQWHEAKLIYTNNAKTDLKIDGATLLYSGDDANTKQWKAADSSALVIYFDDFTVETKEPAFPTSSGLRFNGTFEEGEEVTFYHSFTPSEAGAEDASIVRFLATKDGVTGSLGTCLMGTAFTVPKTPKGATLSFEVVPVDSGILGVKIPYTYAEVVGQDAKLTLSGFAEDGSVTADVVIDNQRFDGSNIKAILIVVMLNDKGGIVKYGEKAIVCLNGRTVSGTEGKLILPTDNVDPASSKATKAAAYLWYCEGNETPSLANTTMVEIVEDEFVVKTQN